MIKGVGSKVEGYRFERMDAGSNPASLPEKVIE